MKTVLVVENDADTRSIYSAFLEHHGYTVYVAPDGPEGVQLAQQKVPDVIVMNLSMPVMDGLSATSILRSDMRTSSIPIIACTGFVKDDGEDMAEDAGCDSYLEKPCEPSRMLREVERFVGAGGEARDTRGVGAHVADEGASIAAPAE